VGDLSRGHIVRCLHGILLSSFGARPFWNSAILGPSFWFRRFHRDGPCRPDDARPRREELLRQGGPRADSHGAFHPGAVPYRLATSSQQHIEAVKLVLGGTLTPPFWIFIVIIGLMLPAFLKFLSSRDAKYRSICLRRWCWPGDCF